jgi:hypothetical protein
MADLLLLYVLYGMVDLSIPADLCSVELVSVAPHGHLLQHVRRHILVRQFL